MDLYYIVSSAMLVGLAACPGDEVPAECEQPDPAASAAFELELENWDGARLLSVDALCTVDAVTVAGGSVTTALTCDVDGTSEPVSLRFAEAPEGAVDWEAGQEVRLVAEKNFDFAAQRIVQLRAAADDAILAVMVDGGRDNNSGYSQAFLPLIYDYTTVCGAESPETGTPAQIDIEDPNGAEIHLVSKHRGSLPIDAGHAYAIDVGKVEIGESPEYPLWQEVLLRHVRVGG